jgi:hypothetical protein
MIRGKPGHIKHINALIFQRLTFFMRGPPVNTFGLGLTIMDFAGLFGEIIANVTAVFGDFLLQLAQFGKRRAKRLYLFALCWWG